MKQQSDSRLLRQLKAFSATASLFSMAVGISGVLGSALHIRFLTTWGVEPVTMKVNTAACFLLAGVSLWFLRESSPSSSRASKFIGRGTAVLMGLAGLLSGLEYFLAWDLGVDQLLTAALPDSTTSALHPALMSPITAFNFMVLAVALLLLDWRTKSNDWPAQFFCVVGGIGASFGFLSLLFAPSATNVTLAVPTTVTFFMVTCGILCSRADWAFGGFLTGSSSGARWLRRMGPAALAVLAGFGWLMSKPLLTTAHFTWFQFGVIAIVVTLLLAALMGWAAVLLDRSERQRKRAEEALNLSRERLDRIMDRYEDAPMEATVRGWSRVGIALGIVLTAFGFLASFRSMRQAVRDDDWVMHSHAVRTAIEATLAHAVEVETGARGFGATGEEIYLEPFENAQYALAGDLDQLASLTSDTPAQQERVKLLRPQITAEIEIAKTLIVARQRTGAVPSGTIFMEGKRRMDAVRSTISEMEKTEARLLDQRQQNAARARGHTETVTLMVALGGVTLLMLAGLVTNREISRSAKLRGQIQALNTDLERRVQARTGELRESEERLRLFIEHAPAALAMFDREMRYLQVSRRWLADYGFGDRDLRGLSHYEIFPGKISERWREAHRRGLAGEVLREESDHFELRDGTVQWIRWEIRPWCQTTGEIGGIVIFTEDITARKLAEEALRESRARLEAALASMTDAVFISDTDGRFIEFNDSFATFHRFKNRAECAKTLAEYPSFLEVFLLNGELAPLDMWAVPRALRGETVTDAEYTLRRKDTGETWVGSYSFAPIRDRDGAIVGSVVVGRDITQKKADELQIRKLNEELEQRVHDRTEKLEAANKELEAFTYSVSHDLRAPLRHISGFSKILTEEFASSLPEEARHHLQRIEEGTRRMGLLVDDLLNLGRVGRQEVRLQVTGLGSIVEEVISDLRRDCEARQVEWKVGALPFVDCDPGLVKQVFQNLMSNALKFTRPRATAVIEIGQRNENGTPVIYVRDNGVGFSMKYAEKLFGVFQRLHRQEDFEGTGVGLATVQRIIQKHGGRIWAEAELDKGATFYFTIGNVEHPEVRVKTAVAGDKA